MEQKNNLTLGSLFDGSGGFPLGGLLAGITPVWASEVEPFPIRVTTKRLPFMKHYGDVTKMHGGEVEPVELCCAIGDDTVDGKPYSEIVDEAGRFIASVGGFEKFAEWGLF